MLKESGIILKNHLPARQKVSLLGDNGERSDAVTVIPKLASTLRPGYRINYSLTCDGRHLPKLSEIEIIFVPRAVSFGNLRFLHQVLSLCIQSIPEGQIVAEVAEFLKLLSHESMCSWGVVRERLFMCRLLSLLGFYPDLDENQLDLQKKVHEISRISVVDFLDIKIDSSIENLLTKWITEFVNEHISQSAIPLFSAIHQV